MKLAKRRAMFHAGAMVCLLAAPWVQVSVSAGIGRPRNALRQPWLAAAALAHANQLPLPRL